MEAGRYEADHYATGTTLNPQTGRTINEHALFLMADQRRDGPAYQRASRLLWLARAFSAHGQFERAAAALGAAVRTSPRHLAAWKAYVETLERTGADAASRRQAFQRMRAAFRQHPDVLEDIGRMEIRALPAGLSPAEQARALRRLTRHLKRHADERSDLMVRATVRQAEALEKSGNTDGAVRIFRKALREHGHETVPFRTLTQQYMAFANRHDRQRVAAKHIRAIFERYHHRRHPRDRFAARTQAELLNLLATIYTGIGRDHLAKRFRKEANALLNQRSL
jgi:tetratricopeptide (TPR) repeat protein